MPFLQWFFTQCSGPLLGGVFPLRGTKADQAGTIGILSGANNGDGANNRPVVDMVREQ